MAEKIPNSSAGFTADNLVVGCGLSGCILAYLHALMLDESSLIIEKRNHIAGNMYDFVDDNGIRVSLYGSVTRNIEYQLVKKYSQSIHATS